MNTIDAVAAGARIDNGRTRLADNYETFMLLLTTQLKNQDPLSPVDSNQFTAQLVQMAGVEQQLLTNDLLQSLLAQNQGGLGSAVEYIGRDVTAAWAAARLENGQAKWSYELGRNAADAQLEVLDGTGKVVWSGPAPNLTEGLHDFVWDGRSSSGATLPDGGVYTLRINATGSTGSQVPAQILVRGRATAVEMYDGKPFLTVGGSILPLANVISVEEPRPAATS